MTTGIYHRVGAEADYEPGQMRAAIVEGRELVVGRTRDGQWFALDNTCTHAFARLCEGRLRGNRLMCPLHGASFDVRNGAVLGAPATTGLAAHALRLVGGQVEVALSGS